MKYLLAFFLLCIIGTYAFAQSSITVSTGGPSGTYSSMFKSMQKMCEDKVTLIEKGSTGSDENIDNLINKVADAAFVQADTLQFVSMNDPRAGPDAIRVLVPLYPEEVHVIALRDLSKTSGGFSIMGKNIGGSKSSLDSLADLQDVKVGAWGGSYTTARAISYLGSVKYETVRYDNDKAALAALDKGEIAAIIAVGGQPLGFAKGLTNKYKLLKIDAGLAGKIKAYGVAHLSYRNLDAAGVETIAPRSLLVVKNYSTPARRDAFAAFKNCLIEHDGDFKEGTGHHPKWSDVDFNAPAVWAIYDTGGVAKAAAPVAATKKGK